MFCMVLLDLQAIVLEVLVLAIILIFMYASSSILMITMSVLYNKLYINTVQTT